MFKMTPWLPISQNGRLARFFSHQYQRKEQRVRQCHNHHSLNPWRVIRAVQFNTQVIRVFEESLEACVHEGIGPLQSRDY